MKTSKVSASRWLRFALASFALVSLASCTHSIRLSSPAQLGRLPESRGPNYTSIVTGTQWLYLGSLGETHEFEYYYNRGDTLRSRRVTLPRAATKLNFPEIAFGSVRQWVEMDQDPSFFRFSMLHSRQPLL